MYVLHDFITISISIDFFPFLNLLRKKKKLSSRKKKYITCEGVFVCVCVSFGYHPVFC